MHAPTTINPFYTTRLSREARPKLAAELRSQQPIYAKLPQAPANASSKNAEIMRNLGTTRLLKPAVNDGPYRVVLFDPHH